MEDEKRAAEAAPKDKGKDTNNQPIQQGFDYISAIGAELERCSQLVNGIPSQIGMFSVKSVNQTLKESHLQPTPKPLYLCLWYEHEACVLFSDSNTGKSVLSMQIASEVAENQSVLYFDFELSAKQFELRYSDEHGNLHKFPEHLYRIELNADALRAGGDFEETLFRDIESVIIQTNAKVIILDNLTFLCINAEKADAASTLMLNLISLKRKYGLSILVVAHTPKRNLCNPLSQNDLAGSKRLINFFDSAFAIGRSAKDTNLRYIKQIKCRNGAFQYDSENVVLCSIEKIGSLLQFINIGYCAEREHLKEPSEKDVSDLSASIRKLASEGKSYRAIATELSISLGKVQRVLKK